MNDIYNPPNGAAFAKINLDDYNADHNVINPR